MEYLIHQVAPIAALLLIVAFIVTRSRRVGLGHSKTYLRRRFWNWFPLGLTYAFLYMGRYNLTVAKNALGELMTKDDFGTIFGIGTLVYGFSFILNGPLTDRWGGRRTILIAALGAAAANLGMGYVLSARPESATVGVFSVLYAANMYFQSFGAVSIVKVNASWFHLRERGTFSGIFGILISLGVFFAFDGGKFVLNLASGGAAKPTSAEIAWVFFVPSVLLLAFFVIELLLVRDRPEDAGLPIFDTGVAELSGAGETLSFLQVVKRMLRHPAVMTVAAVEFFSGYLRQAIMHWYPIFAKETGQASQFVPANWGLVLCMAGITGGVFAGTISDTLFQSRRGPSAVILYGAMVVAALLMFPCLTAPTLGWVVVFLSLCVIGVHGMLSGTASMDFAGQKNTGLAVGIIDGMVYLGTALQATLLGQILPRGADQKIAAEWSLWPWAVAPAALLGFLLTLRLWNATASKRSAGH